VVFIAKEKGNPKRKRREKPVVRSTPPVVDGVVTLADRLKVKLGMVRLAKYKDIYIHEFL
jgi:hypothetical protein